MAFPVTLNGTTYTLADFEGLNYVQGFPDALEDFVTHAGAIYNSTSASSVTIGTGSKTFTTADSGKPYVVGTPLRCVSRADTANFMDGTVTSYSGTTLVINVLNTGGSGAHSDWNITIGGGTASVAIDGGTFTGNLTVTGDLTANAFIGDGSQLTNVVAGGIHTATASGALANGDTVVVNSDGTVSAVSATGLSVSEAIGTATLFESADSYDISIAYDANAQKVVIVYVDSGNSYYGTAVVGTVSGTSISFGTPVVFESATTSFTAVTYDSNAQKVVIAYRDYGNSNYGTAIVGTVSGTSISFGSAAVFESANSTQQSIAYDTNAQKVVIAYQDQGNSSYGTAIVGTVSGTSISFGTAVVFESANSDHIWAVYDSNAQKVVIAYRDVGNSYNGTAIVGTVSGTSISFGSATVFETADTQEISSTYDSDAQKVVIAYRHGEVLNGVTGYGTAIVGTVSGTSISFGSAATFEGGGEVEATSAVYDSNAQKMVIAYRDAGNSDYGTFVVGTVSGTSIAFGSPSVFESASTEYIAAAYDSNAQRVVASYRDAGNSNYGTAVVYQTPFTGTNLTAENYIGISDAAYSDTTTATIQIVGSVDDAQSSLTAGQKYFVQTDGSLGLTADDPEVFAGTAVSATKLIVKG